MTAQSCDFKLPRTAVYCWHHRGGAETRVLMRFARNGIVMTTRTPSSPLCHATETRTQAVWVLLLSKPGWLQIHTTKNTAEHS